VNIWRCRWRASAAAGDGFVLTRATSTAMSANNSANSSNAVSLNLHSALIESQQQQPLSSVVANKRKWWRSRFMRRRTRRWSLVCCGRNSAVRYCVCGGQLDSNSLALTSICCGFVVVPTYALQQILQQIHQKIRSSGSLAFNKPPLQCNTMQCNAIHYVASTTS